MCLYFTALCLPFKILSRILIWSKQNWAVVYTIEPKKCIAYVRIVWHFTVRVLIFGLIVSCNIVCGSLDWENIRGFIVVITFCLFFQRNYFKIDAHMDQISRNWIRFRQMKTYHFILTFLSFFFPPNVLAFFSTYCNIGT